MAKMPYCQYLRIARIKHNMKNPIADATGFNYQLFIIFQKFGRKFGVSFAINS